MNLTSTTVPDLTTTSSTIKTATKTTPKKCQNCQHKLLSIKTESSKPIEQISPHQSITVNADNNHNIKNRHSLPIHCKFNELNLKCNCVLGAKNNSSEMHVENRGDDLLNEKKKSSIKLKCEKRDASTSPQLQMSSKCGNITTAATTISTDVVNSTIATATTDTIETVKSDINQLGKSPQHSNNNKINTASAIPTANNENDNYRLSPRRDITTRNAATSPHFDVRKMISPTSEFKSIPKFINYSETAKILLEKSKSLSETRSQRPLRTTRSLSPRPPIKHQQAIIVSDETDVTVKITPTEEVDEDFILINQNNHRTNLHRKIKMSPYKAHSEQTSPNLSEKGGILCMTAVCNSDYFSTENYYINNNNNRSTSCLAYEPTDPWLKMSDNYDSKKLVNKKIKNIKQQINDLDNSYIDPWIIRLSDDYDTDKNMRKKKQLLSRQSKSMSSQLEEIDSKKSSLPQITTPINRPKLKRTKAPVRLGGDSNIITVCNDTNNTVNDHHNKNNKDLKKLFENDLHKTTTHNFLLNVANPNLLQPRHSFSSITTTTTGITKDDELQLNIRRLSEQMRPPSGYNTVSSSSADFSTYLNQMKIDESLIRKKKPSSPLSAGAVSSNVFFSTTVVSPTENKNLSPSETEIVLETTC